jgi:hypothetical protein
LSSVVVTARNVPRGWQIVFGVVPSFRAWSIGYVVTGLAAWVALEATPHLPSGLRGWCAAVSFACAIVAASILIGLRHSALRRGRERYGSPRASMADLWRYANEERAALLVNLLRRTYDVTQASRWVEEQLRRRRESRLTPPQWLISSLLLPVSAGVTLAVTSLGWKGVVVALSVVTIVFALWLLATQMNLMSLEPLHDLEHLLNLASIRGDTPPVIAPGESERGSGPERVAAG